MGGDCSALGTTKSRDLVPKSNAGLWAVLPSAQLSSRRAADPSSAAAEAADPRPAPPGWPVRVERRQPVDDRDWKRNGHPGCESSASPGGSP